MVTRPFYSSRRLLLLAVMLGLTAFLGGCAFFDTSRWNLDRFRDERSIDIERRLERTEPIVKNPF